MASSVTKINGIFLSKDFALCHVVLSRFGNSRFRPESIRHSLPDVYVRIVSLTNHLRLTPVLKRVGIYITVIHITAQRDSLLS
jgi:hypothetical protein